MKVIPQRTQLSKDLISSRQKPVNNAFMGEQKALKFHRTGRTKDVGVSEGRMRRGAQKE